MQERTGAPATSPGLPPPGLPQTDNPPLSGSEATSTDEFPQVVELEFENSLPEVVSHTSYPQETPAPREIGDDADTSSEASPETEDKEIAIEWNGKEVIEDPVEKEIIPSPVKDEKELVSEEQKQSRAQLFGVSRRRVCIVFALTVCVVITISLVVVLAVVLSRRDSSSGQSGHDNRFAKVRLCGRIMGLISAGHCRGFCWGLT